MSQTTTVAISEDGRRVEILDLPSADDHAPLLLLHEGLGSIELWRGLPQSLRQATGRRVVAFSRFGHGRSDLPAVARTPAFFHQEALEVLPQLCAKLGLASPVLVGHSDGASIALIYAAEHPVTGLVLLAPHVFVEPMCVDAICQTRERYLEGRLRERMSRYHDNVDAAFWNWCNVWLDPGFTSWTIEAEADRLTAPTLLIQGKDDPYGTLEQLQRIEDRVPHARRHVTLGGHSPHVDQRDEVLAAINGFVATLNA